MYMYHSILDKHSPLGKRPGTCFAGVNENTALHKHVFSILGKHPRVQILRVMKKHPQVLVRETIEYTCTQMYSYKFTICSLVHM